MASEIKREMAKKRGGREGEGEEVSPCLGGQGWQGDREKLAKLAKHSHSAASFQCYCPELNGDKVIKGPSFGTFSRAVINEL